MKMTFSNGEICESSNPTEQKVFKKKTLPIFFTFISFELRVCCFLRTPFSP